MLFRLFPLSLLVAVCLTATSVHAYPKNAEPDKCLNYCSNNGVCILNDDNPQCFCLPEWEGERCDAVRKTSSKMESAPQQDLVNGVHLRNHPCSLVPKTLCKNGGQCAYNGSSIVCNCPYTHIGKRCELVSPCNDFCKNGGICTFDEDEDPTCNCTGTGFEGAVCHKVAATTTPAPTTPDPRCDAMEDMCGAGNCYIKNDGSFGCQCPPTHTGEFCDELVSGSGASTSNPGSVTVPSGPGSVTGSGSSGGTTGNGTGSVLPSDGITCANNPCQNGRQCFNTGNTYFCDCGTAFTGANCQSSSG